MLVSNFTPATFAVVKKYTQLAYIFVSKISHRKSTLKFVCKKSACKSSCKIANFCFRWKFGEISVHIYGSSPCEISEARWWTEMKVRSMDRNFMVYFILFYYFIVIIFFNIEFNWLTFLWWLLIWLIFILSSVMQIWKYCYCICAM